MSTNPNSTAIKSLVGDGQETSKTPTKKVFGGTKADKPAEQQKVKLTPVSTLLTPENVKRMAQFRHWKPGGAKVQDVFNMALKLLFDQNSEFSDKPIGDE